MKLYKYFILIPLLTSVLSYSQTETQDNTSKEVRIENKIREADKLWKSLKYKKALAITKQCIKKSDSIKNDSLLAKSYHLSGMINDLLGKPYEAIDDYKKAVNISTKLKKYRMLGLALNNIGVICFNNNMNLDSSIVYYKKALNIFEQHKVTNKIPLASANLGEAYEKANDLKKAKTSLEKAIYYAEIIHPKTKYDNVLLSFTYENYAKIFIKQNKLQKALKYLNLAQEIAEKENLAQQLVTIYKLKSTALVKLGDPKNAYIYLKKHGKHLGIINKMEKSRLVQETAVKFEIKENKVLLEKRKLEKKGRENKIKKSKQIIIFTTTLFLITIITSFLLYKNNKLKLTTNKLLLLKNKELKKLQQETELNFLKTQVQPHFFFNTLNILKTLVLEKSESAKNVVLKLSDLMQYSIYEAKKDRISVWDEINNIQNYLEIQSIYKKENTPSVQINGTIDHIKVPPLLYFSFIEKCFDINNTKGHNKELYIFFNNINDKHLLFSLNCGGTPFEVKKETIDSITIKNIERRLKLIYKDNYSLAIQNTKNTFSASLKIPIICN